MADAPPFERGDIVIVNLPGVDVDEPAIVSLVSSHHIGVRWIIHHTGFKRYYGHAGADCMFWPDEYACIEKVGHIDI